MTGQSDAPEINPAPRSPQEARWEHFSHDADMGVRGYGPTAASAFEQTALALTALVTTEPIQTSTEVTLSCVAPDLDVLLVDWLNALVFEMATRNMLFGRFEVRIQDHSLHAQAWGERVDVARHAPVVEVKGATFTALTVSCNDAGTWRAQCVVDV